MFRTLTFQLTIWFLILFTVLSSTVFVLIYVKLTSNLSRRVDIQLLEDATEIESKCQNLGLNGLKSLFRQEALENGITRKYFLLLSPGLNEIAASNLRPWKGLDVKPAELRNLPNGEFFKTLAVPGLRSKARVLYKRFADGNIIQIGFSLEDDEEFFRSYRQIFGSAIAIMLVCGACVGWLLLRRAMSGVEQITQTAISIGKGDLAQRVPVRNQKTEIDNLATAFNNMLERIQSLVTELENMTNNVAHDLRSPITRIRGVAETTLTSDTNIEEYQKMAGIIVDESDHLIGMINTMLEIAETDSGIVQITKSSVDMVEIIQNAQELFQPIADDKNIKLECDFTAMPLLVMGNVKRLQRVIANLIDNAIKFTPNGGKVHISTRKTETDAVISIEDSGIGIGYEEIQRIFERFYRGEQSRSTPGNGLGLSLVLAIIRAHAGKIDVRSSAGKGSTFVVRLPRIH